MGVKVEATGVDEISEGQLQGEQTDLLLPIISK